MIDRRKEDRRFEARVMAVYRSSHGDRYFTRDFLSDEEEFDGEIYRTINRHEGGIANPRLICYWAENRRKYSEKLKGDADVG